MNNNHFCLCGIRFKSKKHALIHIDLLKDFTDDHGIISKTKLGMFYDFLLWCPWKAMVRSAAITTIIFLIAHKMNLHFESWESMLMGACIGFIV